MAAPIPPARGGITPPTPLRTDSCSPAESAAFAGRERDFFAGHSGTPGTVVDVLSTFGKFKIDRYPNPGNPADVQYVVFFSCNATKKTFEVHGTLARAYRDLARNSQKVFDTGFDPLDGGFRHPVPFQAFDQWLDVLPIDQIVAVEVSYDPKTGREL
jgi:hypothetical protein